jgi:hypothetical protein
MKHTEQTINAMSNEQFLDAAWEITTNKGAASVKGLKAAHKRLKALGYKFFLAFYEDENNRRWTHWGIVSCDAHISYWADLIHRIYGNSLNHCAHKLGNNNATVGWHRYWHF